MKKVDNQNQEITYAKKNNYKIGKKVDKINNEKKLAKNKV